jgi:hypothetical protein
MVGFFSRKPREWRDDDYIFLEDLKKDKPVVDTSRFKEEVEMEGEFRVINPHKDKPSSVKERLDRLHKCEHESLVKRRLENLQDSPSYAPKPLNDNFFNENVVSENKKVEMPDNAIIKRVENAIKEIDKIKTKMERSSSFLSLFYDLKKAEKEFLFVLEEAKEQMVDFPDHLEMKIQEAKTKVRSIK